MDLIPPRCNAPECIVTLQTRTAMARRGDRTLTYPARYWRCDRCADPETGEPPLEFLDAAVMSANDEVLSHAWQEKYAEMIPASGRPGRKTETPLTERVAVLLTPEELRRVDAGRGPRSRSEFLRDVIRKGLRPR